MLRKKGNIPGQAAQLTTFMTFPSWNLDLTIRHMKRGNMIEKFNVEHWPSIPNEAVLKVDPHHRAD